MIQNSGGGDLPQHARGVKLLRNVIVDANRPVGHGSNIVRAGFPPDLEHGGNIDRSPDLTRGFDGSLVRTPFTEKAVVVNRRASAVALVKLQIPSSALVIGYGLSEKSPETVTVVRLRARAGEMSMYGQRSYIRRRKAGGRTTASSSSARPRGPGRRRRGSERTGSARRPIERATSEACCACARLYGRGV